MKTGKKILTLILVVLLAVMVYTPSFAATNVTLYVLNGEEITLTYADAEEGTTYIWKTASSLSNLKKADRATVIDGATTASCTVSASTKIYYGIFDNSGVTLLQSWAINVKDFTNDEAGLSVDASALSGTLEYGSNREVILTFGNASKYLNVEVYLDHQITDSPLSASNSGNAKKIIFCPDTLTPGEHTLSFTVNYYTGISADHTALETDSVESETITYTVANEVEHAATLSFENYDFSFSGVQILNFKKEADTTADNEEPITNYTFLIDEATLDNADFEIHIIPHEGFSYYLGLNYPILVNGTSYIWTSNLADKNVSRTLRAALEDGSKTVPFSVGMRNNPISGMQQYFQFTFTKDETLFVEEQLTNAIPSEGQFENLNALITDKTTYLVIPFGQNTVDVTITIGDNFDGVKVNGGEKIDAVEGKVTATLNASTMGADNSIILTKQGVSTGVGYNIVCTSQKYDAMPDAVTEYLCIGSQYTNGMGLDDYGLRPVRSLVGSNYDAGGARVNGVGGSGPVSLGNFGGYITYYYADAITDDPNNPYGVDFITFGNSVEGSNEFGEPGQVWVSEDGNTWYALAGGMHYEDYADWEYTITYTKNEDGTSSWSDSRGGSAKQDYKYPVPELYPYYDFSNGKDETIELSGIFFNPGGSLNVYGNIRPPFAGFGYTDMGMKYTILPGEDWTGLSGEEREPLESRNIAGNPYLGTYLSGSREFSAVTDGMDLAWAVDADGQPVTFPNGIHYVKIVTASNIENGAIGEKSTEVNMVRVAQANDAPVGKTAAPAKITVDGADVALEDGKFVYDVTVDGPFKVAVDAPEDAHIYINNNCAASANYDGMPLHKIIRVIVQEGEKEPVIYILNLKETEDEPAPAATLTLNANGGTVNGNATYSFKFDASMSGDPLPEPTAPNSNVTFGGWFGGQLRFDAIPDEIQDITLTALWIQPETPPAAETIDVTFRLIGSTLADADVDLSEGMDGFHGAEYVNWVPTTAYTMPKNATIADLFIEAMADAGLRSIGADKGYVSTIYAPEAFGGYELSEFTNGKFSGWMYTMNGKHTNAIREQTMTDGAEIIWHYVNDYRYEVEDWFDEPLWPSLATDDTYYSLWLNAPDTDPNASDAPAGGGSQAGGSDAADGVVPAEDIAAAAEADKALAVETENGTVTLPAEAVQALAEAGEDVTVTVTENADGTTTVDVAVGGETADVDVKVALDAPDEGQVLVIVHADGTEEVVKKSVVEDGTVYAEIPAGATVKVVDNEKTFPDVPEDAWYADAVEFAASHELFAGTDKGFEPAAPMTRAMLAAVLYRLEDATAKGTNPFADVPDGTWYTDAVTWASAEGIVAGTDKGFEPNANITREQIAAMLYRYAKAIGLDMSASAELGAFPDGGDVADWASEAMRWAVGVGLFHGNADGSLNPKGDATRAEVATLLTAMVKLIVK